MPGSPAENQNQKALTKPMPAASQSVAVGLIVTTSLPLWDRIALTVMGILREHRRPLYRNLELCVGETAPREPFRRRPCPLISSPSATLNALIKSKAAQRGQGILRPKLTQRRVRHPHLYGRGDGRTVPLGSELEAWLCFDAGTDGQLTCVQGGDRLSLWTWLIGIGHMIFPSLSKRCRCSMSRLRS